MPARLMIAAAAALALAFGFAISAPDEVEAGPCNPSVQECV
ncbi:hypothetical protein [Mesobacterium pallidum]|nr:hypothetical protein [Mesobacterium pallidum]